MGKETVTIILPLPPRVLSPNCAIGSIGGRFMKSAAARRYRKLAQDAIEAEQLETTPWGKCSVKATFIHKTKRKRDQDNAMATLKAAYDGLVDGGLVPDDDWKHMYREPPEFSVDKKHQMIVLEITRTD